MANPQLLEDLEAVWECLDQAWGHTGFLDMAVLDNGMRTNCVESERVCEVCVEGAIKRMVGTERFLDLEAAILPMGEISAAGWSERSTKAEVMRAVHRAIVEAGGQ